MLSALTCWIAYIIFSYWTITQDTLSNHLQLLRHFEVQPLVVNFFFSGYIVLSALFFRSFHAIEKPLNFNNAIWSAFYFSTIVFITTMVNTQILRMSKDGSIVSYTPELIDFLNNIAIGLIILFATNIAYTYKRMILFQKNNITEKVWKIFELMILTAIVFNFVHVPITHIVSMVMLGGFLVLTFFLATRMPWVAYLSYTQKWRNLLYLFLILCILISFTVYLYSESNQFHAENQQQFIVLDAFQKPIYMDVLMFIFSYTISSLLVLAFNLPTTSVFEQKFSEVISFQKLSEAIHTSQDLNDVYDTFLELSTLTTLSEGSWLEIVDENRAYQKFLNHEIEKDGIEELIKLLRLNKYRVNEELTYIKDIQNLKGSESLSNQKIRSALFVPLFYKDKYMGLLGLVKNIPNAYSTELVDTIESLSRQATISIYNSRLMKHVIETERYKEEISIARKVKQRLLPRLSDRVGDLEVSVFSNSADEVGGDYYDYHQSGNKLTFILADVVGHGTSAAFNMAQLKGIFKSLSIQDLPLKELALLMNDAIHVCVDKKSFITLSLCEIDLVSLKAEILRAGHCPTLVGCNDKCSFLDEDTKTLGMGMVASDKYVRFLETREVHLKQDDFLLLYTDGIIEARNNDNDFFDEDKLLKSVEGMTHSSANELTEKIITDLHSFMANSTIEDDYSTITIKVNKLSQ